MGVVVLRLLALLSAIVFECIMDEEREVQEVCVGVGKQIGYPVNPFNSGSHFRGFQQSKGNRYHVEVIFQARAFIIVDLCVLFDLFYRYLAYR